MGSGYGGQWPMNVEPNSALSAALAYQTLFPQLAGQTFSLQQPLHQMLAQQPVILTMPTHLPASFHPHFVADKRQKLLNGTATGSRWDWSISGDWLVEAPCLEAHSSKAMDERCANSKKASNAHSSSTGSITTGPFWWSFFEAPDPEAAPSFDRSSATSETDDAKKPAQPAVYFANFEIAGIEGCLRTNINPTVGLEASKLYSTSFQWRGRQTDGNKLCSRKDQDGLLTFSEKDGKGFMVGHLNTAMGKIEFTAKQTSSSPSRRYLDQWHHCKPEIKVRKPRAKAPASSKPKDAPNNSASLANTTSSQGAGPSNSQGTTGPQPPSLVQQQPMRLQEQQPMRLHIPSGIPPSGLVGFRPLQ